MYAGLEDSQKMFDEVTARRSGVAEELRRRGAGGQGAGRPGQLSPRTQRPVSTKEVRVRADVGCNGPMARYADPALCPDCGATLPVAPDACPSCALPLRGPVAGELLSTLQHADELLGRPRSNAAAAGPAPTPITTAADAGFPAPAAPAAADVLPAPKVDSRGLSAPSVPMILLGLGALCLLVAAVIFLAVAWSWLGVGGRTAILVAATLASAALGLRLAGRGLRVAGESLTAVALGLLLLDIVGAQDAGWLGDLSGSGLGVFMGVVVAAAGALLLVVSADQDRRLAVPQVVIVLGLLLAQGLAHDLTDATTLLFVAEVVGCAAVVRLARGRGTPLVVVGTTLVGALLWSALVLQRLAESFVREGDVSLRSLWVLGDGYGLMAAVILALLPIVVVPGRDRAWQVALAVAGLGVTSTLVLPALDNGATAAAAAWGVALVGWTGMVLAVGASSSTVLVARASIAVRVPLTLSALVVSGFLAGLAALGLERLLAVGEPFARAYDVDLGPRDAPVNPALVVPGALALLAAAHVALHWRRRKPEVAAVVLLVAALVTLVQYAVPLGWVVAALVAAGLVAVGAAVRASPQPGRVDRVAASCGAVLLLGAVLVALPSAALTAAALAALLAASSVVLVADGVRAAAPTAAGHVAGTVLPLALTGLVWSTVEAWGGVPATDAQLAWCATVVLVGVGGLAIALPRVGIEGAAVVAALLSVPVSIEAAGDESVSLAAHLTLAGVLVTISSLVHRERRFLAVPGGLLLAAATWVRLHDLGVTAPEPYTLPLALVLVAVGLVRLHRDAGAATLPTLMPGLLLATVPSLLWVLDDPLSLRALLLGVACLAVLLGGVMLRWSGPVVAGAAVGGVLVVRELAPYYGQSPQWLVIGFAGVLLTVVGVTWERRLQDLHRVGEALGRLR